MTDPPHCLQHDHWSPTHAEDAQHCRFCVQFVWEKPCIPTSAECIMWAVYCLPGDLKRGALGSGHVIALAVLVLPVTARQYVCMADTVSPPLMA